MESDIVSGQQSAWVLLKKLGEGDAGEVYLVESLLEKQAAILKRPVRSAFASDVIRQTNQITTESKILKGLATALKMQPDLPVHVPEVFDQSRPGTAFSERLFIVIEKARGFDLAFLARTAQMGMPGAGGPPESGSNAAETPEENRFLQTVAECRQTPERVLLSVLNLLLQLFAKIHSEPFDMDGLEAHGVLWNDVKPEHLFWDPWRSRLTIIDWGNGQFLESDGTTRDRRFSADEDYRQLIDAMGRFLETSAPSLLQRLEWPGKGTPILALPEMIQGLQERVWEALQEQLFGLSEAREQEMNLLRHGTGGPEALSERPLSALEAVHRKIIGYGELPDYGGALKLALSDALRYAEADRLEEVQQICEWANGLPGVNPDQLRLVARMAKITIQADARGATGQQHLCMSDAIQAGLLGDWPLVLWNLATALQASPEPDWWYELVTTARRLSMGTEAGDLQPLLIARRTLLTLQSMAERLERSPEVNPASFARLQALVHHLREEIVPNWVSMDPGPPHSHLGYQEIDEMLDEIGAFLPDARQALERSLTPARAQVRLVLQSWEQGDFLAACTGLRQVLLLDPDRKRVLRAEQALDRASEWLAKVQKGPRSGEHYQKFVMEIEYEGRELRNQVGPAGWLGLILEGCRQLRHGAWPPDLLLSLPLIIRELPWLRRYERQERLPAVAFESTPPVPSGPPFAALSGTARGKLGPDQDLHLVAPLDAWIAEARGSSARVFRGLLRDSQTQVVPSAIKLMRMDKVDYSLPLFREEVLVMVAMQGVPGMTPMYECGFLKLDEGKSLPTERDATMQQALSGSLMRIGPVASQDFGHQIEARISEGWTPYIAFEERDPADNLLALCDASMTGGSYRPVAQLLQMSIQICDILQEAHLRKIVYRDHKILHYYWLESSYGIYAIDWNVARLHPEGLSDYEKQMDLVQFGARALHHILTGRTAPGALPLGPTRPEEIEQAAKSYQAQWTYDDQRLPEDLREILEKVLAGEYNNAIRLRDDLKQSFLNLPDI